MTPKFNVGDMVCFAPENVAALKTANRNRTTGSWITDEFYSALMEFKHYGGTVTHTFHPGHDSSVRFYRPSGADVSFHMQSNFCCRALAAYGGGIFIAYPDYINREAVESGGTLHNLFRVVDTNNDTDTSLFDMPTCRRIAGALANGTLTEEFGSESLREIATCQIDLMPTQSKKTVCIVHSNMKKAQNLALEANPGYQLFNAKEES